VRERQGFVVPHEFAARLAHPTSLVRNVSYQYRREWILDAEKFEQLKNPYDTAWEESESSSRADKALAILAEITPEDWQRAAEQRVRFIEAMGDVEVA
jgi:hypothetical protein